jgi:outer membrane receptor protein involved in Fe transport
MNSHARWIRPFVFPSLSPWSIPVAGILLAATATTTTAQQPAQTGSIAGRVTDESGNGVVGADVLIENTTVGGRTRTGGEYIIEQVPAGPQSVRVRMIGFHAVTASVVITPGTRASQDFSLRRDPLQLQEVVTTATQTPHINIESSLAATTLSQADIQRAAPRSTTEMLRYVPGFTRVESSGGEVNQNYTVRGILGIEYVNFLEDGLPVYPTMHTFFMNADNLFRIDENIERVEVVRGGASALYGSNTPGAMINLINKSGGDQFGGTARVTGGTEGLARFDLNANGPLGDDWRFNVGGFYRYDHGVRDPGFPGIRGGQFKGSVTRLLSNGYLRASVKVIDDRNQFILDLPFTNASDPQYVSGFGDYGSFNTGEAINLRVPTPVGDLTLPLDNGLRTQAQWYTADAAFDLDKNWRIQNTGQYMEDHQEHNALVPSNAVPASSFATTAKGQGGLGFPAGSTLQLTYTNVFDASGKVHLPFSTANGLVAPGQLWHVEKPISAFQDQLQLRRAFGKSAATLGVYFANYTQDNHWWFTQILTDVADQTHFLDAVVTPPGGAPDTVTKNGFTNQLSGYTNGSGQTTLISGVLGAELQITDQLRADIGVRGEYDKFVQNAENTSTFDLDNNPLTTYNNETFGNGSFRHFERGIDDWAASLGLNYALKPNFAIYASGTRGYKMPALDEFLNATAQQQADLFQSKEVDAFEGGVKGQFGAIGFTVGGFWTKLKNVVSQGLVIDPVTGASSWIIVPSPENKSYGTEIELVANVYRGLQFFGNATILKAELGAGAGADIGSRLNGVPTSIANAAAVYTAPGGLFLKADWHWVDSRPTNVPGGVALPSYNYFNFGAGYTIGGGTTLNVDLLNAFQSKGLEESNPRLVSTGSVFLARPILPRRLTASIKYDFGGGRRQTVTVPQP